MKHTILGAGGSIGNALTYELLKSKQDIQLVSRSNYSIPGTKSFKADITSYEETLQSVHNADIVYLCAGLPYDINIWNDLWPKVMQNAINACKEVNAKLVFFDNVYMYGRVDGKMTENTPYKPCSKKGELRAKIVSNLENEIKLKNIKALIARAADLYGPYATKTSMPYIMAISNLMKGKNAQWMIDVNTMHSFSYTVDCGKAMVLLVNSEECFNQTWHMPTFNPPITGKEFIEFAALELGKTPGNMVLKKWMVKMAGFFNRTISELYEMLYQYEFDYYFDSTKFNEYFKYKPMNYQDGLHETIEWLKKHP
jgi:nucleoside-diphosphate-sugar epimerase